MEYPKLPSPKSALWFPRIFIAIGIGLLALAGFGVSRQMDRGGSVATTGTVIRLDPEAINRYAPPTENVMTEAERTSVFCPIIGFATPDGRSIEVRGATCSSPPAYQIGEAVPVDYHPDRPEMAAVGSFFTRHALAVVCASMAVPFLLIGLLVRRGMLRRLRAGLDP
jgi:hypothetical protein